MPQWIVFKQYYGDSCQIGITAPQCADGLINSKIPWVRVEADSPQEAQQLGIMMLNEREKAAQAQDKNENPQPSHDNPQPFSVRKVSLIELVYG